MDQHITITIVLLVDGSCFSFRRATAVGVLLVGNNNHNVFTIINNKQALNHPLTLN